MEYIAFMHNNTDTEPSSEEWDSFFSAARRSGLFRGGSEIGERIVIGSKGVPDLTENINGYMRFEADSIEALYELLQSHPVRCHGGTIEICELPKT